MADDFAATVGDWVEAVEGAAEAIFKESVQELVSIAQTPVGAGGRMRVDTGFLRASIESSLSTIPAINPSAFPAEGASYTYDASQITATISAADLGQTIYIGWTAAYAGYREYGARGQPPDAFARSAAQQWVGIVARKEAELRGRLGLG